MNEEEREIELQLDDVLSENRMLKRQLAAVTEEAVRLRHTIEHIYAKAVLAIQIKAPITHADKDSY
jgi:hypothetical protein